MSNHDSPELRDTDHESTHCAGSVEAARPAFRQAGGGAIPTPVLHSLRLIPIPHAIAKCYVERNHYLHSMPGGTDLCFGVLAGGRLLGAMTFGAGPANAYRLVSASRRADCLTLSRLWLSDDLPSNSESRVIGIALRVLRRVTNVKFVVSYADPAQGHLGGIYQATNWLYTGLSEATPLLDLGDGVNRHSRSVSHSLGTHSVRFLTRQGLAVRKVPQQRKHRYIYFLDTACRTRLIPPILPYPKQEVSSDAGN